MNKLILGIFVVLILAVIAALTLSPGKTESPSGDVSSNTPPPSKENVSPAITQKIEHLREVVEKYPDDQKTMLELAQLLQDSHNNGEASKFYKQALQLDAKNNAARIDYSLCLYEMGERDEALNQCRIVLSDDRSNPQALFNMGAIHANEGAVDSAKIYWSKLIARNPDHELAARAEENMQRLGVHSPSL